MTYQPETTEPSKTHKTLLEHYRDVRTRLGDTRTPLAPVIPRERVNPPPPAPPAPPVKVKPEPKPKPEPVLKFVKKEKHPRVKLAPGVVITKLPPRQSTLIMQDIADRHGLTVDDIKSHTRVRRMVLARQEAYCLLREAGYSYLQVGRFCGGRDHSSVMHGIAAHKMRIEEKEETKHD